MKKGFIATIIIILLLNFVLVFVDFDIDKANIYTAILSFVLIPSFLLEITKIQFRLEHKNKLFAKIEITYSLVHFILIYIFSLLFEENGYVIAVIISPIVTFFMFLNKLELKLKSKLLKSIPSTTFWKYGLYSGLTNVVSNFLILIDIYLIGVILNDPLQITIYKYVSIIPFSLLFLPRILITTDFVNLTENIQNKTYIYNYIKNYLKIFILLSFAFFLALYNLSEFILGLFDPKFIIYSDSFVILTIGICGILTLRGLFGNLLSAIGKIEVNFYIIFTAIIINIVSNYYLIPIFGIKGAAITSAILMWFTGISSAIWFLNLFKKK